jgi:hypothetical protein
MVQDATIFRIFSDNEAPAWGERLMVLAKVKDLPLLLHKHCMLLLFAINNDMLITCLNFIGALDKKLPSVTMRA